MSSDLDPTKPFRLLPILDDMSREISDLELEQTRLEAARAREARREVAIAAIARAQRDAEAAHEKGRDKKKDANKTAAEIEEERLEAVRVAESAGDAFTAEFEAAFSVKALNAILKREEQIMKDTHAVSDEARRFAHFAELGAVASPVAKAAIYHLWDVDAMNQPCRCASCGIVLLLKKQYIGDKLVENFCAKCTAEHHRNQLFRDNLSLQEFYLQRTFGRLDEEFKKELGMLENEEEREQRRLVAVEEELSRQLIIDERWKKGPEWFRAMRSEARAKALARTKAAEGVGVLGCEEED